jgi:hypothetical protein
MVLLFISESQILEKQGLQKISGRSVARGMVIFLGRRLELGMAHHGA